MNRQNSNEEQREIAHPGQFVFTPPIDIYETEAGLVLYADLPGVSVGSLELQVQDNKLTLLGKVEPQIPEGARPLHQEYEVGNYLRSFILSGEIVHSEIEAKLANGVLRIFLPKAPKAEPRRIQVNTG